MKPLARSFALLFVSALSALSFGEGTIYPSGARLKALQQIAELDAMKAARTPVQRKIDGNLLATLAMTRGERITPSLARVDTGIVPDPLSRVTVDVDATISDSLLAQIVLLAGEVVHVVPGLNAVRARLPLWSLESLAASPDVRFIGPADEPVTNTGSVDTEGDVAMGADQVRFAFGLTGMGIKVGVISDGVGSLAASQSTGDLGDVEVIPGQAGTGTEGVAMMEVIHDLAPDASLAFATGTGSPAQMASNIVALQNAGCKVIVDDVLWRKQPAFQDGVIAQAVEQAAASGALYFSAAGNDGRSGVWQGDFRDSGVSQTLNGRASAFHTFTTGNDFRNLVTNPGSAGKATLQWTDPWGASDNDYDLYCVDSNGLVVSFGNNSQNGAIDPFEECYVRSGYSLIITRYRGSDRFLRLDIHGGTMEHRTPGQAIYGQPAAAGAFAIVAVNATGKTAPFTGSSAVATSSSDGPRRLYYDASGAPFTPGNLSSTGGIVRSKPDFAAAEGVKTSVAGYSPFSGTSAAASHAAGVAALIAQYDPSLDQAGLRSLLAASRIDLAPTGWDSVAGYGLIMADAAAKKRIWDSFASFTLASDTVDAGSSVQGAIDLTQPAPPIGLSFMLTSTIPSRAVVPSSLTIPGGATHADFTVTTTGSAAAEVDISAQISNGGPKKSVHLTLEGGLPRLQTIAFGPLPHTGGNPLTGTLTLSDPAPAGGLYVRLASDRPALAGVPSSVTVAEGSTSASFAVTTVPVSINKVATITATLSDASSIQQALTVRAPYPVKLAFNPAPVPGGLASSLAVTLSGKSPSDVYQVHLRSSDPSIVTVPTAMTIPIGQESAVVQVATTPVVSNTTATVKAIANLTAVKKSLTVLQARLRSLSYRPSTLKGGTKTTGKIVLSSPAPAGGLQVTLTSNKPSVVPNATVDVPAGATSVQFTQTTLSVSSTQTVTVVAAMAGSTSKSATLTISP